MTTEQDAPEAPRFEEEPLTRPEYLGVLTHFYRAEVARATAWRQRLDTTTNWAIIASAGMLSFTFASPNHTHLLLLLNNLVVVMFMVIETRRYRRYEVYQARVRMLETNFLAPIVSRSLISPMGGQWRAEVWKDLAAPTYKTKFVPALGFRLRRNYFFVFLILLGAWLVKLELHPTLAGSLAEFAARAQVGSLLSPALVFIGVAVFFGLLLVLLWLGHGIHAAGPTDEVQGVEEHLERWKL